MIDFRSNLKILRGDSTKKAHMVEAGKSLGIAPRDTHHIYWLPHVQKVLFRTTTKGSS